MAKHDNLQNNTATKSICLLVAMLSFVTLLVVAGVVVAVDIFVLVLLLCSLLQLLFLVLRKCMRIFPFFSLQFAICRQLAVYKYFSVCLLHGVPVLLFRSLRFLTCETFMFVQKRNKKNVTYSANQPPAHQQEIGQSVSQKNSLIAFVEPAA